MKQLRFYDLQFFHSLLQNDKNFRRDAQKYAR